MNLGKLESSPSLTDQAYEALKEAILCLDLEPGHSLSVPALAEQLGVSRTPIMTALRRLESDGLVSGTDHKRGIQVTMPTYEDVEEILELRALLEGYVARAAATSLSPQELDQAETIVKRQEDLFSQGLVMQAREVGHQFHLLLLSKPHNRRLIGFLEQLDTQYTRIRRYLAKVAELEKQSIDGHWSVLKALRARDGQAASAAMEEHLNAVKNDILAALFPGADPANSLLPEDGAGLLRNDGRAPAFAP